MGFGKSSPFLALSILVLCQAGGLQATPLRWALESLPDSDLAALNEKEGHLLASLVKAYAQRNTNELDQPEEQETEAEDSSVTHQKRSCNLPTCAIHRLEDYLYKHMGILKEDFEPTDVGPKSYGRRRRELHA
ncbi:calcitonin gene-related peptide 2-like [Myotis yumanensis]|uniref:calcitonin gene-related peptide 2-like n=1 Tax=Myotis yumanensis TaxID=159337 RepID=UPI0038D3EA52